MAPNLPSLLVLLLPVQCTARLYSLSGAAERGGGEGVSYDSKKAWYPSLLRFREGPISLSYGAEKGGMRR
jgi:hypothetical protein